MICVKHHYQVGKYLKFIRNESIFVFVECGDPTVTCLNGACVDTTDPNIPVYCQCYDGTRRTPTQNDTCPLSSSIDLKKTFFRRCSYCF